MDNNYRKEYTERINRVIDYINANIYEPLNLEILAEVAAFSKYHFHKIFSSITGESIGCYISRLKLEKAAGSIASPEGKPITDIAMDFGYSSPSVFSRAFKEYFGVSPAVWRNGGWKEHSKNCKLQSNKYQLPKNYCKATKTTVGYNEYNKRQWRIEMKVENKELNYSVRVEDIKEQTVAYVRHMGPYAGDSQLFDRLFGTLMRWAGPRDLFVPRKTKMLTIYHDSPDITEEEKLRISVCITVPQNTKAEGEIGVMTIPDGKFAVGEFYIGMEQYGEAWNHLFGIWLPESGYQCADGPCYEEYLNDPTTDPEGKHKIAIHVPVKPL